MELKDLFAKLKSRDDHFNAEGSPEIPPAAPIPTPVPAVQPAKDPAPVLDENLVIIGNTHYRRVRLKIVDAWSEDTVDRIQRLEADLNKAHKEIAKLTADNVRKTEQHTIMQQLNINLHSLRVADVDKSTDRINQLEQKANSRQERIKDVEEQLREARMLIHEARLAIELLENENNALQSQLSQLQKPSLGKASLVTGGVQWAE